MPRITRRRALRGGVGMLTVGVVGCSGGGSDGSPEDDGSTPSENGAESDTSADEGTTSTENGEDSSDISESLAVGESYTNPIGNTVTVTDIELQDTVEAQPRLGDGESYRREPEEGEQWAVVTLEITNDSGQTQHLTPSFQIVVRANGTEHQPTAVNNDEDTYQPEEVQDGESSAGWLAYGVPDGVTMADIEVVHSNSADGENWTVTWSDG